MKQLLKSALGSVYFNVYQRFRKERGHRIMIYHAFGSKLEHDSYGISIPIERFRSHVTQVYAQHATVQVQSDLFKVPAGSTSTVSITFDDGYKDNLLAAEILSDFGIPFSIFVVTDRIGDSGYLSESDLVDLSKNPLCQIGSHTCSHRRLAMLSEGLQRQEIFESRRVLEAKLSIPIKGLAYPYGSYNSVSCRLAEEAGYEFALCSDVGVNRFGCMDRFHLKRSEIIASDSAASVQKKIKGYFDYLTISKFKTSLP